MIPKSQQIPDLAQFFASFVKFSIEVKDFDVETVQPGKNLLSSRLFRRDICGFLTEKYLKLTPKMKKKLFFSTLNSKTFKFLSL